MGRNPRQNMETRCSAPLCIDFFSLFTGIVTWIQLFPDISQKTGFLSSFQLVMCEISVYEDKLLLNSIANLGSAKYCGSESLSYANTWDHDFFSVSLGLFSFLFHTFFLFSPLYSSLACRFFSFVFNLFFLNYLYLCFFLRPPALLIIFQGLWERKMGQSLLFSIVQMKIERFYTERFREIGEGVLLLWECSLLPLFCKSLSLVSPGGSRQERALKFLPEIENR